MRATRNARVFRYFKAWGMSKIIELVDSTLSNCCARNCSRASCQQLSADNSRIKASNSAACKRKESAKGRQAWRGTFLEERENAKERTRARSTESLSLCVSGKKNTSINTRVPLSFLTTFSINIVPANIIRCATRSFIAFLKYFVILYFDIMF